MPKPGEIDEDGSRAYELSVKSDHALKAGDLSRARELMIEATILDGRYSVRAEFVGRTDDRRVRVSPTMRKMLIAPLLQIGFRLAEGTSWKAGAFLERQTGDVTQSLLPGVKKFGRAIGVLACREAAGAVAYFDWKGSSLRTGRLDYRTQAELEAVCSRWVNVLREEVLPWLERGDA